MDTRTGEISEFLNNEELKKAVEEERLKAKLSNGDFEGIFSVLKRWAERND